MALLDEYTFISHSPSALRVAFSVSAAAGLLLRHRAPEAALLLALLGPGSLAPLIALYYLAELRGPVLLSATGATATGITYATVQAASDGIPAIVLEHLSPTPVIVCFLGPTAAVATGRLARSRRKRLQEMALRQHWEKWMVAEEATAAERGRLAREMHDVVSHKISLISLQAGALQVARPSEMDTKETAQLIQQLSAQAVTELHEMLAVLHEVDTADTRMPLRHRLSELAEHVHAGGIRFRLHTPDPWPVMTKAAEHAVWRTVQESLTNASKYAPGSPVSVSVTTADGVLRVEVESGTPRRDAPTVEPRGMGLGLRGLAERAHLLGGRFAAEATPDGGFLVTATFPL